MKTKEYIPILNAGENIGFSASSSLAKGTSTKTSTEKNSGGYLELKDKLLTLVSKASAKLLVFSDISKLISNF